MYMVDRANDALYTIATSTGAATRVNRSTYKFRAGVFTPSSLTWIGPPAAEVSDDDELPGLYMGDVTGNLYKVATSTGVATRVARLGTNDITGLAWFGETSTLYFVDDSSDALQVVTDFPGFLPNEGDLYYNGSNFADGFVRWNNPQWVLSHACSADPLRCSTYEHDLKLEWKTSGGWFDVNRAETFPPALPLINIDSGPFCTAWSDLPMGYDDCATAAEGTYREQETVELSFGTFKAPHIESGRDYYGFWIFKNQRGSGSTTDVKLYGQEGKPGRGPWYNRRCGTVRAEDLWCVEGRKEACSSPVPPGDTVPLATLLSNYLKTLVSVQYFG